MPYRFAGKLVHNGVLQIFLSKGDTPVPIKQGEILDGTYRVESIGEDRVTLTYLPLGQRENIPVASALSAAAPAAPLFGPAPLTSSLQPNHGMVLFGGSVASAPGNPFLTPRDGPEAAGTAAGRQSLPAVLQRGKPQ